MILSTLENIQRMKAWIELEFSYGKVKIISQPMGGIPKKKKIIIQINANKKKSILLNQ